MSLQPFTTGEACQVPRDVHDRVWSKRAAEHAHDADPAYIRITGGANDLRYQWSIRVALQHGKRIPAKSGGRGQRGQRRRREGGSEQVQHLVDADAALGGDGDHWVEPAA